MHVPTFARGKGHTLMDRVSLAAEVRYMQLHM
jgi:hypothetical protein